MSPALAAGALLLFIGFYGIMTKRNFLLILVSLELMLNGVNITLVTFARQHAGESWASLETMLHATADAQLLVMMVFAVAACEAAVALSILVTLFRQNRSVDVDRLFEPGQG